MAFVTFCDNKGCRKEQLPLLNTATNEVVCSECGKPINSITSFAKSQLKSLGQVTSKRKTQETYSVKCGSCQKEGRPVLQNDKLICVQCSGEITTLSKPFEIILKKALTSNK